MTSYQCIEAIASNQRYRIRQHTAASGWGEPNAFGALGYLLDEDTRIHFYHVWRVIEVPQSVCDLGIAIDAFKSLMWLHAEESSELVQLKT